MNVLAPFINEQNNRIDIAKMKGQEVCMLIDVPPSIREGLIDYYVNLIGYRVDEHGFIHFKKLLFLNRDDNLVSSVFVKKGDTK